MPTSYCKPSATLVSLPPELLQQIFYNFDGDRSTLRACALVSQELLPHARSCLYGNLSLPAILMPYGHLSRNHNLNTSSIAIALCNPDISASVRTLVLPQWEIAHWFPQIVPKLVNVVKLTLPSLRLGTMSEGESETLYRSFKQVRKLVLSSLQTDWSSIVVLRKFILSFPKLTELEYFCGEVASLRQRGSGAALHLESLSTGVSQIPHLLAAFQELRVQKLEIEDWCTIPGAVSAQALANIMVTLGSSLKELVFLSRAHSLSSSISSPPLLIIFL